MYNRKQIELIRQQLTHVANIQSLFRVDTSLTTMCIKVVDQYLKVEASAMIVLKENERLRAENATLADMLNSNVRTAIKELPVTT